MRRLERILVEALEEEATPVITAATTPPGRFARPGSVFAIALYGGNHHGDQNEGEPS